MNGEKVASRIQGALSETFAATIGEKPERIGYRIVSDAPIADGTTVILLSRADGTPAAAVLCSPAGYPHMVDHAMDRAARMKEAIGPVLGERILDPLLRGRVEGASFAVLPYCHPLSSGRLLSRVQNVALRPSLFDWTFELTRSTASVNDDAHTHDRFAKRLEHVVSRDMLDPHMRAAASAALDRLASGQWKPRHVLMHGDLWRGNVLLRPVTSVPGKTHLGERFVVIDWPGAELAGYAIFDVVRLAYSMRMTHRQLAFEIARHCNALQCEPLDAMSYLVAAFGHVGLSLDCFPVEQYVKAASLSFGALTACLADI